MVRNFFSILYICLFLHVTAQVNNKHSYIHEGLIRFMGTLSYGNLFSQKANNIFLHGDIEYYTNNNFSVRSDGYIFLNSFNGPKPFIMHHSIFSGINYHFNTRSHLDPYFGFQPGINLAQQSEPEILQHIVLPVMPEREPTASPLISGITGINYYGTKFFHFTLNVRYIYGMFTDNYNAFSLSEFRVSFGLGFNFR